MFHLTYTACKRPLACTAVTPSPPGCNAMVSSAAACSIWHMAHSLKCIVNGDDSAVFRSFVPGDLTCKLVQARNQTQRGTKHVFTVNLAQICSTVLKYLIIFICSLVVTRQNIYSTYALSYCLIPNKIK